MSMRIKQGSTIPYAYQIRDSDKTPVDLANATSVVFTAIKDGSPDTKITVTCNFIDRAEGQITIPWASGSTATLGMYSADFKITWSDGTIEHVPSNSEEWLLISSCNQ